MDRADLEKTDSEIELMERLIKNLENVEVDHGEYLSAGSEKEYREKIGRVIEMLKDGSLVANKHFTHWVKVAATQEGWVLEAPEIDDA